MRVVTGITLTRAHTHTHTPLFKISWCCCCCLGCTAVQEAAGQLGAAHTESLKLLAQRDAQLQALEVERGAQITERDAKIAYRDAKIQVGASTASPCRWVPALPALVGLGLAVPALVGLGQGQLLLEGQDWPVLFLVVILENSKSYWKPAGCS